MPGYGRAIMCQFNSRMSLSVGSTSGAGIPAIDYAYRFLCTLPHLGFERTAGPHGKDPGDHDRNLPGPGAARHLDQPEHMVKAWLARQLGIVSGRAQKLG